MQRLLEEVFADPEVEALIQTLDRVLGLFFNLVGADANPAREALQRDREDLLGLVVALYVTDIAPVLERLLGFQIMPGDVYYVTEIPSEIRWYQVAAISSAAFVLTSLATLYPARRAALVNPAAALRYE